MMLMQAGRFVSAALTVMWMMSVLGSLSALYALPGLEIAWRLPLMLAIALLPYWAYVVLTKKVAAEKARRVARDPDGNTPRDS